MEKRTAVNKNNYKIKRLFFILLPFFFLSLFFYSCKTPVVKEEFNEVDPISLLDIDKSVYVSVPVENYLDLTSNILSAKIDNLSVEDAKQMAQRIDFLYAALATVKDRSSMQIAATGSFPSIALKTVMTEKNGWNKQNYVSPSSEEALSKNYPNKFDYYLRNDTDLQISFPSKNIFCASQNVFPLLDKYSLRQERQATNANNWISQESNDILFYITRPGQYLRSLIGQAVTIDCDCIYGSIVYVPSKADSKEYTGNYNLNFNVTLIEKKAMKGMMLLLDLSLRMMGGEIYQYDDSTISIKNIPVTERQIVNLFTREKITSKHIVPPKD